MVVEAVNMSEKLRNPIKLVDKETDEVINKYCLCMHLNAIRKMSHYTQEELAAVSGVSIGTISRIETGKEITLGSLIKLANTCGYELVLKKRIDGQQYYGTPLDDNAFYSNPPIKNGFRDPEFLQEMMAMSDD